MLTGVTLTCAGVTALLEDCVIRLGTNKTYSLEKIERNSLEKDQTKPPEIIEIEFVSRGSMLWDTKNKKCFPILSKFSRPLDFIFYIANIMTTIEII